MHTPKYNEALTAAAARKLDAEARLNDRPTLETPIVHPTVRLPLALCAVALGIALTLLGVFVGQRSRPEYAAPLCDPRVEENCR